MREIMLVPLPRASDKRLISFDFPDLNTAFQAAGGSGCLRHYEGEPRQVFFFSLDGEGTLECVVEALGSVDS